MNFLSPLQGSAMVWFCCDLLLSLFIRSTFLSYFCPTVHIHCASFLASLSRQWVSLCIRENLIQPAALSPVRPIFENHQSPLKSSSEPNCLCYSDLQLCYHLRLKLRPCCLYFLYIIPTHCNKLKT
jgi:hypothetical protein